MGDSLGAEGLSRIHKTLSVIPVCTKNSKKFFNSIDCGTWSGSAYLDWVRVISVGLAPVSVVSR